MTSNDMTIALGHSGLASAFMIPRRRKSSSGSYLEILIVEGMSRKAFGAVNIFYDRTKKDHGAEESTSDNEYIQTLMTVHFL